MPLEKRFISHYMLTETIRIEENYCRWLAEDMRANKEVWITEFFEKSENGVGNKWLNLASEIKKISTSSIIQISDFFHESDSVFIVTEMPRGEILKPLKHYNEDRFRKIGEELLKTLILLQRNGIGFDSLSLNDIFVDNRGEIKLFFSENWILKSENESREKEIALFAIVLLNFLGFENEEKIEITQDFLKEFAPEKIYPLFEETLIDRKNHRFEALSRYFQEKMKVSVDPMIDTDEAESFKLNRSMRYVMLGILAVVMYMMLTSNNDIAKSKWFDVWRYQVLANMGMSEPQRILGELYEKGYGVERDMIRSIEWYRKAAQSGNVYAQMSLGHFYDKGIGVPLDRKQALYWFTLAATNGDKIAKEYVALLSGPSKEEVDKKEIVKKEEENSTKQDDKNLKQDTTNNQPLETIKNPANGTEEVSKQSIQGNEMFMDAENVPVGGSGGLEITNNQTVAQSFTTTHRGRLLAIDLIDLKIHRCLPKESLYVSLVNIENGQLGVYSFFTRELHPNEVTNTTRLYFGSYGPIVNPGEQYAVFLQTKANGCTYAWGGEYETYDGGETFINKIQNKRDMKFRSFIRED
ncbi:Sel1-like repeat-containing protein kinase family protein [uncultured Sulfuricurvum sp.]|uniref:Sel1-like repeat-containing protein kinase family protein n=1 Tax=uncultured Sulfuricurvum sp. TaxID=430693 RepID=UPI00260F1ACD|nr:Sel1-like repeat-containing protein kinase family protein [uncultured Sulfuricurvum sp.]